MKVLAVVYASNKLAGVVCSAMEVLGAELCEGIPNTLSIHETVKAHNPDVIVATPSSLQHVKQCVTDIPVVTMATETDPEDLARRIREAVES